jgi:pilus assembly protein CpaE
MRILTAAVVSADPTLRGAIGQSQSVSVILEVPVAATEIGVPELQELEAAASDLVLVDLGDDLELGLKLVQFLTESVPGRSILVVGPPPSAEVLLETMRAGGAEYLPAPLTPEAVSQVVERIARRLAPTNAGESGPGRVYTFVGVKGGMGTTMVASNVATELRRGSGRATLLADFRFGLGDAAIHLGLSPRFNVLDLIDNLHRMDPGLLASFVESDETGVQLLSSPGEAEKIGAVEPEQIREVLRFLRRQYVYTVVDAPDPYSPHARAVFAESDRIFLVATPEVPALRNVERVLPLLDHGEGGHPHDPRLVVNRFVPSRSVPVEEIERLVGLKVQATIANDYETVTSAINEGSPIAGTRTAVARDLAKLAASLHQHGEEADDRPSRGGPRLLRSLAEWARGAGRGASAAGRARGAPREE